MNIRCVDIRNKEYFVVMVAGDVAPIIGDDLVVPDGSLNNSVVRIMGRKIDGDGTITCMVMDSPANWELARQIEEGTADVC